MLTHSRERIRELAAPPFSDEFYRNVMNDVNQRWRYGTLMALSVRLIQLGVPGAESIAEAEKTNHQSVDEALSPKKIRRRSREEQDRAMDALAQRVFQLGSLLPPVDADGAFLAERAQVEALVTAGEELKAEEARREVSVPQHERRTRLMNWKLTVNYMGHTAMQTVSEAELADRWTFVDISEDVDKCDGGHFEDEDGPTEHPLAWKDAKATETRCGPWRGAGEDSTVEFCDRLLARADLPALVRGATLEETFHIDGPNANALDVLDRAEWTLEALPDFADTDIE